MRKKYTCDNYIEDGICPKCKGKADVYEKIDTATLSVRCNKCGNYKITRTLIEDEFETK